MLDAFFEVLKDLYHFAFKRPDFKPVHHTDNVKEESGEPKVTKNDLFTGIVLPTSSGDELSEREVFIAQNNVRCLAKTKLDFDSVLATFDYGQKVAVLQIDGDYSLVKSGSVKGWVRKDYLTDDVNQILPNFESGYTYRENNTEVIKLRNLINDETSAGELNLTLQAEEYILYKLKNEKIKPAWPTLRPRKAGQWHKLLRGVKGVNMSVEPKTKSIFESTGEENILILGWVSAVTPDQSVVLQSVSTNNEGEYEVKTFTQDEWKEMRPIFISVN